MVVFIIIYFLSVFFAWRYIHIAYSDRGCWAKGEPDFSDIVVTLFPILNTFVAVFSWLLFYPKKTNKITIEYNKFFRIKK